ncbi:MAG: pseudouridine synthase [Bdellovibrionales bacterium]|nr:pseudouridine synthase [Bdellovibrionales bacterium]
MDSESDVQPYEIQNLQVLFQNEEFVVIHKPPGMHVHQPEMARRRVPREITVLWTLRRQIGKFLYPVHRLDVQTEGVLVMALQSETAGQLQAELQAGRVRKVYHAICRGWTAADGRIEIPLERDSNGTLAEAVTEYRTLEKVECPFQIGKRYSSARYSLVEARPLTGRWHQIRRHLARETHPIIGDREHGDSHHSKYFREQLGLRGLWLRASLLEFEHKGVAFSFEAPLTERWLTAGRQLKFSDKIIQGMGGRLGK